MRKIARLAVAIVATCGLSGLGSLPPASAELDASTEWGVIARADAMAIEYLNTAAPVFGAEPVVYGTPATAQSLVDSVGQSNAFAAAPYPGDILVGMPDNGNGIAKGNGAPGVIPNYPFYVRTDYPISRDAVNDQSGNRVVAHSDQYLSSSEARSGLITGDMLAALQAEASSRSAVDSISGELLAGADSRLDAFKVTEQLRIGRSVAHAKVVKVPGQDLVKESSFTIGSIIVNGVEMSYGDQGFKFADQAPSSPGDPTPLFAALEAAGITVEILPARGTETSIESAGMKITQVLDYGSGQQRISFIIGRVSAAIRGEAKPAAPDGLLDTTVPAESINQDAPGFTVGPMPTDSGASLEETPQMPSELNLAAGIALESPSVAVPDLALPSVTAGPQNVPPVVAAVSPHGRANAESRRAVPEVRLASPASVGRGLRNDDISGFYLAAGGLAVLMTVAAFVLAGGRRVARTATADSVLKLPS